jgi:hypothetical protein
MKKSLRMTVAAAVAVAALTAGLTSASAALTHPTPIPPGGQAQGQGAHPEGVTPQAVPLRPAKSEAVFVSLTPCRILDTRVHGGAMAVNATRTFNVGGTSGFVPQGGKSGGCGIPTSATAIAATIGSVGQTHPGYLTAWPSNLARPLASNLNYGVGQPIATGGTISVQPGVGASLKIFNFGGPTQTWVDVTGYYAPQMAGMIAPDGSIYSGTSRIVSASQISTGVYRVNFDTDVSYCTPMVDTYNGHVYGSAYAFNGNSVVVYTWYIDATTHLEVPNSYYVYLSVTC